MRFEGKLDKWNDDRGLGYIVPQRGGDPVYVHISAFPADGRRPRIGEVLTFEVEAGRDGQRHAVNVQRPGHKLMRTTHTPEPRHTGRGARSWAGPAVAALLVAGGVYAYMQFWGGSNDAASNGSSGTSAPLYSSPPPSGFRCDGRVRCTQMTSCAEAKFFLASCPGVEMDADYNGIPCEQTLCVSGKER